MQHNKIAHGRHSPTAVGLALHSADPRWVPPGASISVAPALRHSYWIYLELHERAGLALRQLFGTNVSACRDALRYFGEEPETSARRGGSRQAERCIAGWCSEG